MKMMGLKETVLWLAWFVKYFIILVVTSVVISIFSKTTYGADHAVFPKADVSLVLVFLLLYSAATIAFTFAVSAPCSKGQPSLPASLCQKKSAMRKLEKVRCFAHFTQS